MSVLPFVLPGSACQVGMSVVIHVAGRNGRTVCGQGGRFGGRLRPARGLEVDCQRCLDRVRGPSTRPAA